MNRRELKDVLQKEGIRSDMYDLDSGHESERYTIRESHGVWDVYYSERGLESGNRKFLNESDACEYLLRALRQDPSSRAR